MNNIYLKRAKDFYNVASSVYTEVPTNVDKYAVLGSMLNTCAVLALWQLLEFYKGKVALIWDLQYLLVMLPDDVKIPHDFYMMADTLSSWNVTTPGDETVILSATKIKIGFDVVGEVLDLVDATCGAAENSESKAANS